MQNRVIFKVISTGLNFLMSIVIGILVPRDIGPTAYGDFSYIISTYAFLFQFLMFSSSTAYIYFLSNNKHKIEDINTFYMLFLTIISVIIIFVWAISANIEYGVKYLWNELENQQLLFLGLVFSIFTTLQLRLIEFSDSTSQTVQAEKLKLISRFIMVLSVMIFIFYDKLNLYLFFIISILNLSLFLFLFIKYINFKLIPINLQKIKFVFEDFYLYLKPLIMFTLIAAIYSYIGKYVLQSSSGSLEQGYYNFAFQLAMIPVSFISSIMAIYMSEMTKKFKANDINGVKKIFIDNIFRIYAVHAFISFFMMINAKELILLTVGESYLGAIGAVQGLAVFSLLNTFGMLSANLFFSSGRNKQYSIINSSVMFIGIIYMIYLLVYSNLDATHLAIIMAAFYMSRVIIQLYVNLTYLSISKIKFISELLMITFLIIIVCYSVQYYKANLFINLIVTIILLIIINFLFKDYLTIKKALKND